MIHESSPLKDSERAMPCPNYYTSVIDVMPHGGVTIRHLARFRTPTMEDSTNTPGMASIYGSYRAEPWFQSSLKQQFQYMAVSYGSHPKFASLNAQIKPQHRHGSGLGSDSAGYTTNRILHAIIIII